MSANSDLFDADTDIFNPNIVTDDDDNHNDIDDDLCGGPSTTSWSSVQELLKQGWSI